MGICSCTLPYICGYDVCKRCNNNNFGYYSFKYNEVWTPIEYKEWNVVPPKENISFFEAIKFLNDGYKIKRKDYYHWICLDKDKKMVIYEDEINEPMDEFEFDYSDISAKDWFAEKRK